VAVDKPRGDNFIRSVNHTRPGDVHFLGNLRGRTDGDDSFSGNGNRAIMQSAGKGLPGRHAGQDFRGAADE
jgi:hypothetical protein